MRVAIATLVLGGALAAASAASASFLPPGGEWRLVHVAGPPVTTIKPLKLVKSCNAQSKARNAVGRVSRRTHPVACEQPPRSEVLNGSFVITFGR